MTVSPAGSRPPSDNAQVRPHGAHSGPGAVNSRDGGERPSSFLREAADAALRALHAEVPYLQDSYGISRNPQDEEKQYAGVPLGSSRISAPGAAGLGATARRRSGGGEGANQQGLAPHQLLYASAVSSGRDAHSSDRQRRLTDPMSRSSASTAPCGETASTASRRRANEGPCAAHPSSLASLLQQPSTPRQPAMSKPLPAKGFPARQAAREAGRVAVLASVAAEPNASFRAHMEDSAVIVDPFMVDDDRDAEQWGFFAVYDGHGGQQAVDYTEAKLHEILLNELRAVRPALPHSTAPAMGRWSDEVVGEAMTRTFMKVDDQLRLVGAWRCGCTATVALFRKTQNAMRLHVANVGDSRAIAVDCMHDEWRVSVDHRPTEISEVKRVESEGGFVSRGRVAGQLGVSRALGDHALKSSGVSWKPTITTRDSTQDVALVIASDGLWDAMSDADSRTIVVRCLEDQIPDQAAQCLVDEAQQRGSRDNITCLVVFFDVALQA